MGMVEQCETRNARYRVQNRHRKFPLPLWEKECDFNLQSTIHRFPYHSLTNYQNSTSNSHFEIPTVGQASSLVFMCLKIRQEGMPSMYFG